MAPEPVSYGRRLEVIMEKMECHNFTRVKDKGPLYTVTVTVKEPYANVIGRIDIELPRDEALELLEQCGDAFKVAEDVDF